MTNKVIARPLKETAELIELTGGNPFRARALANAARIVERLEVPVSELIASGEIANIKGIGSGLVSQIEEIIAYGSFELRDDILGGLPPGLLDVLSVKGLGAKKVRALWQKLGIQSLEDLEAAAQTGQIATLEGFAEKSQQTILENIAHLRSYEGKRRISDAWIDADQLQQLVTSHPAIESVSFGGDIARLMDVVDEIIVVVKLKAGNTFSPTFIEEVVSSLQLPGVPQTESRVDSIRVTSSFSDGMPYAIVFVSAERFGPVLTSEIGPASFVAQLGLVDAPASLRSEKEVFEWKKLPFIPPELRDLPQCIERAEALSELSLLEFSQLKGVLHNHSTYSDGAHSLTDMSLAVRKAGFGYFGICDHSQSLKIASGMSVATARKQKAEITRLNLGFEKEATARIAAPFKVFFGVESDILSDGSLDYEDEMLAEFDFIVASVHVKFNMSEAEATDRLIKAISNPYTTILGHPTGRLLLKREGYPIDHKAVLEACAHYGVAVELNANPYRLDLDWRWIETAISLGVLVSINPDAHSIDQLDLMKWGALVARKGGLTAPGCLNAMTLEQFEAFLQQRKKPMSVN